MRYLHTMVRVRDLDASLRFYCDALGLRETRRKEYPQGRFTLVFLAAPADNPAQTGFSPGRHFRLTQASVPMRDGVKLHTRVYVPRATREKLPIILLRTPYGIDSRAERPDVALMRAERAAEVRAAIRNLPPKQRATLILRVYHELPHEEIAAVLGGSVGAAKANFFHALANLKKLLR